MAERYGCGRRACVQHKRERDNNTGNYATADRIRPGGPDDAETARHTDLYTGESYADPS
jgi:hypothetical protein